MFAWLHGCKDVREHVCVQARMHVLQGRTYAHNDKHLVAMPPLVIGFLKEALAQALLGSSTEARHI